MQTLSIASKAPSGISDSNTTVGGASASRQQLGFERRVAWLEEDVSVLHRRLQGECGDNGLGGAAGDQGLRALVARLDGELSAERRARESMEARLASVEATLREERAERDAQMNAFSGELEVTLRGLIGRIDDGLSLGASRVRERTDETESRLQRLISRVDEGLSAGAVALQETLCVTEASMELSRPRSPRPARPQSPAAGRASHSPSRQTSVVCLAMGSPGPTPLATPNFAFPETLQVPGSGLSMAVGGPGALTSGSPITAAHVFRPASVVLGVGSVRPSPQPLVVLQHGRT